MISVAMLRSSVVRPWVGILGIGASAVYLVNQADMIATVINGFPVWGPAGLIGSLLWATWVLVVGISLVGLPRRRRFARLGSAEVVPAS